MLFSFVPTPRSVADSLSSAWDVLVECLFRGLSGYLRKRLAIKRRAAANEFPRREEDNTPASPSGDYVTSESVFPISKCSSARAKSGELATVRLGTSTSKIVHFPSVSGNPSINESVAYRFSAANAFPVPLTSCDVSGCHNYALCPWVSLTREAPIFLCYTFIECPLCNGVFPCAIRSG